MKAGLTRSMETMSCRPLRAIVTVLSVTRTVLKGPSYGHCRDDVRFPRRTKTCDASASDLGTKLGRWSADDRGATGRSPSMCRRSWAVYEAGSVIAEAGESPRNSPGSRSGWPYVSSADVQPRSSLKAAQMPSSTRGRARVQEELP